MGWCMAMVVWLMVSLCVGWWLECKAVLGCCDDDMMCQALGWLVLAECMDLCEWVDGNYLMCYIQACCVGCDANEKGLGRGQSLLKRDRTIVCGLLEHGQRPHDVLRYGLACAEYAAIVISSYQTVLSFLDVQTYCIGVGNMENKPRQYQLKVS